MGQKICFEVGCMDNDKRKYIGMVSADWNQCLAPCGPFDVIAYHFKQLGTDLGAIFKRYTANAICLDDAIKQIKSLCPAPITEAKMDDYLARQFKTYAGVPELMTWCARHRILFMVNTTGMVGYFQRALAKDLLPALPVLSAHPVVMFAKGASDPALLYKLSEIPDKCTHTAAAAATFNISTDHIVVVGDSGGDGPHFQWAQSVGATTVASMAKPSLVKYCQRRGVTIQHQFGHTYAPDEPVNVEKEMGYNFMDLTDNIARVAGL